MIEGYIELAAAILRSQALAYETALKNWAKVKEWVLTDKRVNLIEQELLSEYYSILTFHKLDMLDYINTKRRSFGLPERKRND